MGRRKDETHRILGPYWSKAKQKWFAKVLEPRGNEPGCRSHDRWFGRELGEAQGWVDESRGKLVRIQGVTIESALTQYQTFLTETGHKKPSTKESATETIRRLRLFFGGVLTMRVSRLTEDKGEELYRSFAARTYTVGPPKAPRQKPYSVAHHRHTLAQAKSFMRWCVKPQKWISVSPLEGVNGFGARNVGKEQLTGNEAIKFYEWCVYKAHRGDEAALALLMLLLMALRQGDVRNRVVRDVDLGATRLRIGVGSSTRSKTKKGDRPRRIPEVLQPLIKKLIEGRSPLEPLFKTDDSGFHTKTWLKAAAIRFCAQAEVPYVCPHGLKGTTGTLATDSGALADQVADYLSHESKKTTETNYIAGGATADAVAEAGLRVITGGKR